MHFFCPVPVMPLIELIRAPATSDATEAAIRELAAQLGKQVIVSADRPGFIVNRILMPLLAEAMRAYEEGSAPPRTSTRAPGSASTTRWGRSSSPTSSASTSAWASAACCTRDRRGAVPAARDPGAAGRRGQLGQKTGEGFYRYPR